MGFDWVVFRDLDLTEIGAGLPADGLAVGFDALLLTQARERMGQSVQGSRVVTPATFARPL